jgi:hypothetical protein
MPQTVESETETNEAVPTASLATAAVDGPREQVESIYRPLKDSLQYTRLLTLSRNTDARICCDLEHVQLSDLLDYTALSYCWGSSDDTRTVTVNGKDFRITRNLYDALERLHHMKVSRL